MILGLPERLNRTGCLIFPSWQYINHNCICTTGKVLKLNNIYTYKEGLYVDIVQLFDVHIERGFLYCSLSFFPKNKTITVCHTLQKDVYVLWRLMDNKEYDELLSRKFWHEVDSKGGLLKFDFGG
jgi:hypothetical protein